MIATSDSSIIEADTPIGAAWKVRQRGFALCRSALPLAVIEQVVYCYAEPLDGPQRPNVSRVEMPAIFQTFDVMLGTRCKVSGSGLKELIPAPLDQSDWHQDGGIRACVWLAITECGGDAPGLSLLLQAGSEIVPDLSASYFARREGNVLTPHFRPGDALFFNGFSIYRTVQTPEMPLDRLVVKLSATPLDQDSLIG